MRGRTLRAVRGGPEWSGQVRNRAPTSPASPAVDLRRRRRRPRPRSASGRRRAASAGRRGSSRRRPAAGRGRCRTARRRAAAARRGARIAASTSAAGRSTGDDDRQVALDRGMARRRGHPRGGELPAGQARDRDLGDDDPLGPQVERLDDGRMELADAGRRAAPPASTRAARPGCRFGSSVSGASRGAGKPEPAGQQLEDALRVVEVVRPGPAGSRPAARRRRSARTRAATTRGSAARPSRRSPCRPRRSRRRRGPWRRFVETTSSRLPSRLWRRTECWLDSGLVTTTGRPAGRCSGSPVGRAVVVEREPLDHPRARRGRSVTTSVSPAPASVSRTASRTSSGSCR